MLEYKYIFPYEKIPANSRIILYGAGLAGTQYLNQILVTNYCKIIGIIDKKYQNAVPCLFPFYTVNDLPNINFDYVVITIQNPKFIHEIITTLLDCGVQRDRIIQGDRRIPLPYNAPISISISSDSEFSSVLCKPEDTVLNTMVQNYNFNNLVIVSLMGGLGNQLYQYIFAKYLETITNNKVIFDDSYFYTIDKEKTHGGLLELENIFPITIKKLSKFFANDWEYLIELYQKGIPVWHQLLKAGVQLDIIYDRIMWNSIGNRNLNYGTTWDTAAHSMKPINTAYYMGYWQGECMTILRNKQFKQRIIHELAFPEFTNSMNREYAQKILNERSAAIHIRRGDYVSLGWDINPEYYKQCITFLEKEASPASYYVFSDDAMYCKENADIYGIESIKYKTVFVNINHGKESYNDLHLMTLCKYLIPSLGSTFSRMAKILSKRDMIVVSSSSELSSWYC